MSANSCPGIPVNTDISGPGVRISLYLQALLTVVLVRVSPGDAPAAYWSMTATALGLIVSSVATALLREISLLDAVIVIHVLILPVVASAFGIAHLSTRTNNTSLRRVHSPLLIVTNWLRSALTYAFALFVWGTVPNFGSGPAECDKATKFIVFGAAVSALGTGRTLNIVVWSLLSGHLAWRTYRGRFTLLLAFRGIFLKDNVMFQPKGLFDLDEMCHETVTRYTYHTNTTEHRERVHRPGRVIQAVLQGMMTRVLRLTPSAARGHWLLKNGQFILTTIICAWSIAMTELHLMRNDLEVDINSAWGYGQVLPLILTISPLFSLWEALLKSRVCGPISSFKRRLRFCIEGATGLKSCDPTSTLDNLPQEPLATSHDPSPFAVLTVDGTDFYNTFHQDSTQDPIWGECFDAEVTDSSTIVIRVFDVKGKGGQPTLMGHTVVAPFAMLLTESQPQNGHPSTSAFAGPSDPISQAFPLTFDGEILSGASVTFSISQDTTSPLRQSLIPSRYLNVQRRQADASVSFFSWGGRKFGRRENRRAEAYRLLPGSNEVHEMGLMY